jgi:hypothetical protein
MKGRDMTSVIGEVGNYPENDEDDFGSTGFIIFNNNPGRGSFYIGMEVYQMEEDGRGPFHRHDFFAMTFDGMSANKLCFVDTPEECLPYVPPFDRDAAVADVAAFRRDDYDRLKSGELELEV